ncbi:hypothetical protein A2738_03040 [Candidatus Nomurabacteria bacterium RIFCSPHIGHO2_01_FULL_42_15]|uniref:Fibronectin type-III domain-containing protein n=1 Tax=Candidatus Nomurabacteria bacterium RIFCSPHIGHO2_01_FULL_42_15 TaxID=1801742 RepID=A0A1F6VEV3_9BACT|nr:MAG: hypothetical protein A2738_03040 [Candidatus Nomurabacteria bacterium RIFCSPHIGHO2_01_FULL_42_15]OGI92840.1 MAG: hypothetical protein A3A99_03105 [Candidatus Nomurabacteria bacterium RIFCSPLOWO2_01_FULL_41_18]
MSNKNKFFTFNKFSARLALVFAIFFGLLAFIAAPSAKADFWDDVVDFINPVEHIENIIDGRPQDNLPPIPGFSGDNDSVTKIYINNQVPYPTLSIYANPSSVNYNESSTIHWNSSGTTYCNASGGTNGWAGNKSLSGSFFTGNLTYTTTYLITCGNNNSSVSDSVTIYVNPAQVQNPTVNISANPSNVSYNGSTTVTWNSNNATYCNATGGSSGWSGGKSTSGTFFSGNLTNTVTFYITCRNNSGVASDSVTVSVDNDNNNDDDGNVSVDITADDTSIDFEDDTRIRWDSDNADYCRTSDGTNDWEDEDIDTSGSFNTGSLDSDETFRITCYNNSDSATDSVTIRVSDEENEEPEVITRSATNVSSTSATLRGRVDGNGSSARAWFEYGTNTSLGYTTSENSYGSDSSEFSRSVSGLIPNTTYYFRAVAENSEDTIFGNMLSFNTTGNVVNPVNNQPTVVIYADQTNIAYSSATTVRWNTTNATTCFASGGSLGWAGAKEVSQGSFYTGSLTGSRTYTIACSNSVGSSTDSVTVNVRGQVLGASTTVRPAPAPTSLVLVNSSLGQPVSSMIDNTRPRPGDEINYTIGYQNIGTASITSVILQVVLPQEVTYVYASGSLPSVYGNTLIFNLGTLGGNAQGTVTVRVRVRDNAIPGTYLNFPATLSYINPAGAPQSVTTNASAQVWNDPIVNQDGNLGASAFGSGFLPTDIFGWLLLFVLIMILVLLAKYLFGGYIPWSRQTVTTYDDNHPFEKKTTTTTLHE